MRILLVEDDIILARSIEVMLTASGAIVHMADAGQEAIELANHYDYDIVILDLGLPDTDGMDVVRRIRAARIHTPILIISGLTRPQARVRALGLGADDFLTKPFDRDELQARVLAIIRRAKGFARSTISVQGLTIDIENKKVAFQDRPVPLTGKEYQILELLVLRKNMTIPKETFLDHLYGGRDEPEIKIIDVFVCKLRKKLEVAGLPDLISTAWGRGYVIQDRGHAAEASLPRPNAPTRPVLEVA
jgi:two-component system cell cycle response regulator CtrA